MRRPSGKGSHDDATDLPESKGDGECEGEDEDEDEVHMVEDEPLEDSLIDDDEDQVGIHLQKPRPKKPKFPHKKIILSVDTQKEMKQLEAELKKTNPDKKFIKKAMDTTFLQRRKWVQEECPTAQEVLLKYPIFKKSKYVSLRDSYIYIDYYSQL